MSTYFLGLDIGTDSVGWAVTDEHYQIIRKRGKALWGVRLFDSAQTAEERRGYRVARRRIERRTQRLHWLQDLFAEEISKMDPAFFDRLRESKFLEEDKKSSYPLGRYTLFADQNYCDKDYHQQFPTIYHLRKALIEDSSPFDVRLVYLAIHHILKNRGHFLYGDLPLETISLERGLDRLAQAMELETDRSLHTDEPEKLKQILISATGNKTWRKKELAALFSVEKKDGPLFAVVELMAGATVSLDALYGEGTGTEEISKISLEQDFDLVEEKLTTVLGDRLELILAIKEICDWARLETMRNGEKYLSFARVKRYEKHQQDLKRLKAAVKSLEDPSLYREIFHIAKNKLNNYPAYCGKGSQNYRCSYDDFRKYLIGKLKNLKNQQPELEQILIELEQGTFLPRQASKDNGIVPHQLHEVELVRILENAQAYLPFLNQKDSSGLTRAEQIRQMFRFRIPYYVGPLDSRSNHSWITRKNEKIFPWNFSQVVDLEACRKEFIHRMTARCSYIGEPVLPKDSLLYTKYMVLNELNNLRINGRNISPAQKQQIYQDLFLSGKKVTSAKLRSYLRLEKEDELSGFDQDFKGTLAPWNYFRWLTERPGGVEMAEEIIRHITLFGDDKKLLRQWIQKIYGKQLTEEEQKRALSFKAAGWGRLSQKFLTGIYHTDPDTGEALSIMDLLWQTNNNLMELLSSRYTFMESVEAYRREKNGSCGYTLQEYLDESYASPAIKRSIHQVIAIVSELQGIMKAPPKRIFVEMAREEGEKGKRTISRKAELTALYEKCGEESSNLFEQLSGEEEGALRRDKLYLYYTQLGRCMYSGEAIDLNELDSHYDIDHIYPQSKVKDDSIRNRVLVKRELNAAKGDQYPLSAQVREKMRSFWTMLRQKGFISKEKYDRLLRATPFTTEEQAGFIARQLVETRQSSKIVAELLKRRFGENTEIVYVKAGNVSSFRQDQRLTDSGEQKQAGQCKQEHTVQDPLFVKCREVNDYHHAKDAYLNIVVGNVYHVKFTRSPANFLREKNVKFSLNRMFDFDVSRNGETAWTAGPEGSIAIVRQVMGKNNILFTRRAAEVTGGFFDQMPVAAGKGQAMLKSSDPRMTTEKYGGYNKLTGAYFALVEYKNKKKQIRSLETVFLMHKTLYEQEPERYFQEILGLKDVKILIPKIQMNALFSYDGFRMHLSSRTGSNLRFKNANQLVLAPMWNQYIKNISKYLERCKTAKRDLPISSFDGLTKEQNEQLYSLLIKKLETPLFSIKFDSAKQHLCQHKEQFITLDIPNQCRIILQILVMLANSAASADLTLIGAPANTGLLSLSQNIGNAKGHQITLIYQSVTGFYEHEVDLLAEEIQ